MNLLTNIAAAANIDFNTKIENIGDILSFGGEKVLIGMATVFSVLIVIWISIIGLKYLFANFNKKSDEDVAPEPVAQPVYQAPPTVCDGEVIAAIAAAIAMAEAENTGLKFRVVSFRRK